MGSSSICPGNTVWAVAGSRMPLILQRQYAPESRSAGSRERLDLERLCFDSMEYVRGVMGGEAAREGKAEEERRFQELVLV